MSNAKTDIERQDPMSNAKSDVERQHQDVGHFASHLTGARL